MAHPLEDVKIVFSELGKQTDELTLIAQQLGATVLDAAPTAVPSVVIANGFSVHAHKVIAGTNRLMSVPSAPPTVHLCVLQDTARCSCTTLPISLPADALWFFHLSILASGACQRLPKCCPAPDAQLAAGVPAPEHQGAQLSSAMCSGEAGCRPDTPATDVICTFAVHLDAQSTV